MTKNGLFFISIGLLIFMFSVNRTTLQYNLLSMVTGIFFIVVGAALVYKVKQDEKKGKKE
ncbi:DUF3188 domain-containing protein [Vagococcus lutrae]|uniref:DUF3188 domain-containing protein n=1 Tax=Vagococcus lutrae TaxID=81947 RepID=UPI00200E2B9B|nr:DUF3188 domain-containing protein [Vagococcus lutrae]MDT2805904.1 DUF3188 domain-containing protein [Vagococcus lutrae]MDT2823884.1 DUF3188 domain-containing protein [Vagococcus lutrae]UQF18068.1 DUF3188 domain-containing protein [Vagococcus lutrae]